MSSLTEADNFEKKQVSTYQSNEQLMDKNNYSTSLQAVEERDQNKNLSSISTSFQTIQNISSKLRSKKEQLNSLSNLIPRKPSESSTQKVELNDIYSTFKKSIAEIESSILEIPQQYISFKQKFNDVYETLYYIFKQIYDKIEGNQVISEKLLDNQKKQLENAKTLITRFVTDQESFQKQLKNKKFSEQATLFKQAINIGTQIFHQQKEIEDYKAEVLIKESEVNTEKSKKKSVEIEMNISKQQEDRLEDDLKATKKQKEDLITQNQEQQNLLKNNANNKKLIMEMITQQIKQNKVAKKETFDHYSKENLLRSKETQKMFDNTLNEYNELQITQDSRGFIIVLDESGSMSGKPFSNCVQAIKEQVNYLKSKFQEDEFCMIQFSSKARTTINKRLVKEVNEADIGKSFNGGGTSFFNAFQQVKEEMPLFESQVVNIMFITDGGDSDTSAYLAVLKDIKQQYSFKKIQLFGLAFGSEVSPQNIKDCLKEVNGSKMHINANNKKIQSYFEVNVAEDIIITLRKMFESQSSSIERFNDKQVKKQELLDKQFEEYNKLRENELKKYDDLDEKLQDQLEKLTRNTIDSQVTGMNELVDTLEQQKFKFDSKITSLEQLIEEKKLKKLDFEKQLHNITDNITNLEKKLLNFQSSVSQFIQEQAIKKESQVFEADFNELGFKSKNHYTELQEKLKNVDEIEQVLNIFSCEMSNSMNSLDKIREFISNGIIQISDSIDIKQEDIQFQLDNLVTKLMPKQAKDQNQKELSKEEKMKFLIMATSKDEYDRIFQDKELAYPFQRLYSSLAFNDLFQLKQAQGGQNRNNLNQVIDQYVNKIFKEIFYFREKKTTNPALQQAEQKKNQLLDQIKQEEGKEEQNQSKLDSLNQQKEMLEQTINQHQEAIEQIKTENEENFYQLIDNHIPEYDFTRNVIRNIRDAILLIDYRYRQNVTFQPLQTQKFALLSLSEQCGQINQLSIE